jgi:hypothetical protein
MIWRVNIRNRSSLSNDHQQAGDEEIRYQNEHGSRHHCLSGSATDALRAAARRQAVVAPDGGNDEPEN